MGVGDVLARDVPRHSGRMLSLLVLSKWDKTGGVGGGELLC